MLGRCHTFLIINSWDFHIQIICLIFGQCYSKLISLVRNMTQCDLQRGCHLPLMQGRPEFYPCVILTLGCVNIVNEP